jgi:hypothetical protein
VQGLHAGLATPTLGVAEDKDYSDEPRAMAAFAYRCTNTSMNAIGRKKMSTKTRGRRAKGPGTTIGVRCHEPLLAMLDAYRRNEPDLLTRASALRRLATIALKASKEPKPLDRLTLIKSLDTALERHGGGASE